MAKEKGWISIDEIPTESIINAAKELAKVQELGEIYKSSEDYKERRRVLRQYYELMREKIENNIRINTTKFPFDAHFSPLEMQLYSMSYSVGIKLFPEYPAGRFYLDFAIPTLKIDIECDGKAFHNDLTDRFRDAELRQMGWNVYRLSSGAINKSISDLMDGKGIRDTWDDMQYYEQNEYGRDYQYYKLGILDRYKSDSAEALLEYIKMAFIDRVIDFNEEEDDA